MKYKTIKLFQLIGVKKDSTDTKQERFRTFAYKFIKLGHRTH